MFPPSLRARPSEKPQERRSGLDPARGTDKVPLRVVFDEMSAPRARFGLADAGLLEAKTKKGRQRCNVAARGSAFCATHQDNIDLVAMASTVIGGILGNFAAPGPGGNGRRPGNITHRIRRE